MSSERQGANIEEQLSALLDYNSHAVTIETVRLRGRKTDSTVHGIIRLPRRRDKGFAPAVAWMLGLLVLIGLGVGIGISFTGTSHGNVQPGGGGGRKSVASCSLITPTEASQLLHAPVTAPTMQSAALCQYHGVGMSTLTIQTQQTHALPQCADAAECASKGEKVVTVGGVSARWQPAGSLPGESGNPFANILAFNEGGYFVNIDLEHVPQPESLAEAAMALVLERLDKVSGLGLKLSDYLQLDHTRVRAGTSFSGSLVVYNPGKAVNLVIGGDCQPLQATLDRGNYHQDYSVGLPLCVSHTILQHGSNRFPVAVDTTYSGCVQSGPATPTMPKCSPSEGLTPLPAGMYIVSLESTPSPAIPFPKTVVLTLVG